jgi:hypothetical protein
MDALLKNLDGFCSRLNAGLAAVAIVLTVLVAAELTTRLPDLYQQAIDVESTAMMANVNSSGF